MPTAPLARTQPSAAPLDVERERAELSRALAERWPKAARDVLVIAVRAARFNRCALGLGLPPIAAAEPLAAASALRAVMKSEDWRSPPRAP